MKIITTSKEIIERIEDALVRQASYGIPVQSYISEALITIEHDGHTQSFRLREFNDEAQREHAKMLKQLSGNKNFNTDTLQPLDDFGREFTIKDFTKEDFNNVMDLANEVENHFLVTEKNKTEKFKHDTNFG